MLQQDAKRSGLQLSSVVFSCQLHNDGPHTWHCRNATANPNQAMSDEQVPTPPVAPISLQQLATDGSFAAVQEVQRCMNEHVEISTCDSEMHVANQDAQQSFETFESS